MATSGETPAPSGRGFLCAIHPIASINSERPAAPYLPIRPLSWPISSLSSSDPPAFSISSRSSLTSELKPGGKFRPGVGPARRA